MCLEFVLHCRVPEPKPAGTGGEEGRERSVRKQLFLVVYRSKDKVQLGKVAKSPSYTHDSWPSAQYGEAMKLA
jgi:hypothetical protein